MTYYTIIPLRGMKAAVNYHIPLLPLRGMKFKEGIPQGHESSGEVPQSL